MIIRLLFLFFLIIIERVGFPLAISTAWIMTHISASEAETNRAFGFAVIAGVICDLVYSGRLGSMSLVLLLVTGFLLLIQGYVPQTKRLWLMVGTFLTESLRQMLYYGSVNFLQVGIVTIISLVISSLFITQHTLGSGVSLKQWIR